MRFSTIAAAAADSWSFSAFAFRSDYPASIAATLSFVGFPRRPRHLVLYPVRPSQDVPGSLGGTVGITRSFLVGKGSIQTLYGQSILQVWTSRLFSVH